MMERMKWKEEIARESVWEGLIGRGSLVGGWPAQHSQWMRQASVDLLTQTPYLMNQTWFLSVRRTPSQCLCACQNKAQLH